MTDERSAADLRDKRVASSVNSTPSTGSPASPSSTDRTSTEAEGLRGRNQGLTTQSRDRIATQLRAMYDTVASQPVPDRFAELIAKLDAAERNA